MKSTPLIFLAALTIALVGCEGDSGSSPGSPATGSVSVLLGDCPVEQLQSFTVQVSAVVLLSAEGSVTLSSGEPLEMNLLSLNLLNQLVASAEVPVGEYEGVQLEIASAEATSAAGAEKVCGASFPLTVAIHFAKKLSVKAGAHCTVSLDFDLDDSISDGGPGNVLLDPVVTAEVDDDATDEDGDEEDDDVFEGKVTSVDPEDGTIEVEGDGGRVTADLSGGVCVTAGTVVFGNAICSRLRPGARVRLQGSFCGCHFHVRRLFLAGGFFGRAPIQFSGIVLGTNGWVSAVRLTNADDDATTPCFSKVSVWTAGAIVATPNGRLLPGCDLPIGAAARFACVRLWDGRLAAVAVQIQATQLTGTVAAVNGTSLTLSNGKCEAFPLGDMPIHVTLGADTECTVGSKVKSAPKVGDQVSVLAEFTGSGYFAAAVQIAATEISASASATGNFSLSDAGGSFQLAARNVKVTAQTLIVFVRGGSCDMISPEDLPALLEQNPDAVVEVEGDDDGGPIESDQIIVKGNNGVGNGQDPQPPGTPPVNDGPGTSPGNPGNQGGF